jgi:quercetin dioxygenase-like cupin family protein
MIMKLVKVGEGNPYEAPKHFKYWAIKKITPEDGAKNIVVGISHFLPGGGGEMSSSPQERVYVCMEGEIAVKNKNNEEFVLNAGDMIYIAANEERSFQVPNTKPATILTIISKVN